MPSSLCELRKGSKQEMKYENNRGSSLVLQLLTGGHGFHPWSGKIPRVKEQPSPCATSIEPLVHNKRSHPMGNLCSATRESLWNNKDPAQPEIGRSINIFKKESNGVQPTLCGKKAGGVAMCWFCSVGPKNLKTTGIPAVMSSENPTGRSL